MLKQVDLFRKLQASLGVALAAIPLSPNQWTMISVLIAFAAAGRAEDFQKLSLHLWELEFLFYILHCST